MFLVNDSLVNKHVVIRNAELFIAPLLLAEDFEWTVRQAILALGCSPTEMIREKLFCGCSVLDAYTKAWRSELKLLVVKTLLRVIPNWLFFKKTHFLRHRSIQGISGTVTHRYSVERAESFLAASGSFVILAENFNSPIHEKNVRRKRRNL